MADSQTPAPLAKALSSQIENPSTTPTVSSVTLKEEKTNLPALKELERYWTLYYRCGARPPESKNFKFAGNLEEAMKRARKHCDIIHIRFLCVRPLFVDLDYQEDQYTQGLLEDEGFLRS